MRKTAWLLGFVGFGCFGLLYFSLLCCLLILVGSRSPIYRHQSSCKKLPSYLSVISFPSHWTVVCWVIPCLRAFRCLDPCLSDLLSWIFEQEVSVFMLWFSCLKWRILHSWLDTSLALRKMISWVLKTPFSFWSTLMVSFFYSSSPLCLAELPCTAIVVWINGISSILLTALVSNGRHLQLTVIKTAAISLTTV